MDLIGPDRCEQEFENIKKLILENWEGWGWAGQLKALARGVAGLCKKDSGAWDMDAKTDPVGSMLRLAIKRAREKEAAKNQG